MEFEDRQRNVRPQEGSRNLPMMVLLVLVGIICALLFIGWKYMSDDVVHTDGLTSVPADSLAKVEAAPVKEDVATATSSTPVVTTDKKEEDSKVKTEADKKTDKAEAIKDETPAPTGGKSASHTVGEGETFFGIANRYNMKWETLKKLNPGIEPNGIKVGVTDLKLRVKAIHTVGPGDVLKVVSAKYNVPVELIMQANKKTKNYAQRGEQLIIPYATKE